MTPTAVEVMARWAGRWAGPTGTAPGPSACVRGLRGRLIKITTMVCAFRETLEPLPLHPAIGLTYGDYHAVH
jgi:hypothetical protein